MMLCLFCAPALAQSSSPSAAQYEPGTCPPAPAACTSAGVVDAPEEFVANSEQGTDAVNEAMGAASSPADVSAASGEASVPGSPVPTEGGSAGGNETGVPDDITELPEMGGAPLTVLGSGAVLATLGLITRRVVGR